MMFKSHFASSKQLWTMIYFYFFKCHFFFIKRAPFLLKIGEDLNIDDYENKNTWN